MDFDSPTAARKAVSALNDIGIQAQMAKVSIIVCKIDLLYSQFF